jgi:hypothetical protein
MRWNIRSSIKHYKQLHITQDCYTTHQKEEKKLDTYHSDRIQSTKYNMRKCFMYILTSMLISVVFWVLFERASKDELSKFRLNYGRKHWKDYYHRGLSTKGCPSLQEASFRNTSWTSDRFMSLEVCSYVERWEGLKSYSRFLSRKSWIASLLKFVGTRLTRT